ncbi:DeoR/GlpR family DNA-binding transcription regulator [Brevibacillus humidisoli]|nr:DeoR/GlpR family DNA-binding transcription regulator [Brevibacillus humidisoli]UFJ43265.1 DeoR/GlpR family DNA-binding transcription regulator [Brevibacillus humidisoli]
MYGEERKAQILEYVNRHSRASVQELTSSFGVSESTIRRDLQELEDAKLLRRTHGGAVSLQSVTFEPTFGEKEEAYRKEKEAIARKAVSFIEEGDTILLDSGTTTFFIVKELKAFTRLTVVTNSVMFAQELQNQPGIELLLAGGSLRKETLALVGPLTEQALQMVRVDKAFIATNGLDLEEGLTTPNLVEAATKKQMIKIAKEVILVTDHSKLGKVAFAKVAELADIDRCIIDNNAPLSTIRELERSGIDVHVVQPEEE